MKYLVEIARIQGLNLLTKLQPGSMAAGLLCEQFFKTLLSPKTTVESMLHMYGTSVCKPLNAEQKSSLQVLESSNHKYHGDVTLNVAVLWRPGSALVTIARNSFTCVTWCSTSQDAHTACIPGDWSCQCP
jgi:hypothetical protein